ncbi:MAG: fatty acid desaturase [Chloroflexota bacterium]|nr:fatty acid desaturase [Chloroflexota bacterium]
MASTSPMPKVPDTWKQLVAPYQQPDLRKSLWQLANTIVPYFALLILMYFSLDVSYWLTLLLAIPAAGFGVRMFIIFHDAGHGSFFKSKVANDWLGRITGVLLFTPYYSWRHSHAIHHATSGDLDRRGTGDVWTLTKEEYDKLGRWGKLGYRLYRNPFVIFGIGPVIDFVVLQRFAWAKADERDRASIRNTNIALVVWITLISLLIGFDKYVLIQLPVLMIATGVGVWLFYVQHQFENTYWERHEQWDFATAALYGSSFYKLPKLLQWFTGNIGFHHIHHLSPRIPNYELERCHNNAELFQRVEQLTLWTSLKSLHVRLWDEDHHKMVGYHAPSES